MSDETKKPPHGGKHVAANRPTTITEYHNWARSALAVDFEDRAVATMYNVNAAALLSNTQSSVFFQRLVERLTSAAEQYAAGCGEQMFMAHPLPVPIILKKPYESLVEKTFRKNVVWNRKFPAEPSDGWIKPTNWLTSIDDILRTSLVCRFLDGPEQAIKALDGLASDLGLSMRIEARGLDEGYYAHHCYVGIPADLLVEGKPTQATVEIEIQITTQLQDVLRNMTHRYYAQDRIAQGGKEWKWQFKTNRFRARFLGHSLHLLEAFIVDVRDKKE